MRNYKKGFTLIELLVVIAIIGILSSVVLASLNSARAKGANAAIKANLANIRAQAELYYDNMGSYGAPSTGCTAGMFTDPIITKALQAADSAAGGTQLSTVNCVSVGGSAWAISTQLKVAEGTNGVLTHWCVDSAGTSKGQAGPVSATNAACL